MTIQLPPHDRIAAILPCYSATGDSTTVITTDGTSRTTGLRLKTIINRLARSRAADLTSLKKNSTYSTQRAILQPLPLTPGLVLCPVKVRTPRIPGDPSTGYINLHAVTGVAKNHNQPYRTTVNLAGGTAVPVLWSTATVNKHLQSARLAMNTTPAYSTVHESAAAYADIAHIARKLVEVIYDILTLKQSKT